MKQLMQKEGGTGSGDWLGWSSSAPEKFLSKIQYGSTPSSSPTSSIDMVK
jgi:hypothetical protein